MKYTPISSWWLLNEDFENGHWDFYVIRTYTCTPFEFCLATFFNKLAVKETLLLVYMILTDKHVCSVSDCLYREYTDSVHCDLFVVCQAIPADEWYLISKLSFSVFFLFVGEVSVVMILWNVCYYSDFLWSFHSFSLHAASAGLLMF